MRGHVCKRRFSSCLPFGYANAALIRYSKRHRSLCHASLSSRCIQLDYPDHGLQSAKSTPPRAVATLVERDRDGAEAMARGAHPPDFPQRRLLGRIFLQMQTVGTQSVSKLGVANPLTLAALGAAGRRVSARRSPRAPIGTPLP
jgi:hypothetical protein